MKFDSQGKQAIKDIKSMYDFSQALTPALGIATVLNMFLGNRAIEASYSFASTDFELLAKAMQKVPEITRQRVYQTAMSAALFSSSREQQLFFRAVAEGCKL